MSLKLGLGQPRLEAQPGAKKILQILWKISHFYSLSSVDKSGILLNSRDIYILPQHWFFLFVNKIILWYYSKQQLTSCWSLVLARKSRFKLDWRSVKKKKRNHSHWRHCFLFQTICRREKTLVVGERSWKLIFYPYFLAIMNNLLLFLVLLHHLFPLLQLMHHHNLFLCWPLFLAQLCCLLKNIVILIRKNCSAS